MYHSTPRDQQGFGSPAYRWYALTALLVIYIFNAIDRVLLAVLQERIKVDLQFSDFQLGLLGGPAFVILYTLSQLPIARLAERKNRITIISLGAAAWSIATATCGLAQNFVQLALSRIGVGIGEAACVPPSHSTISDYFPINKRATAFAVFGLGIPIGTTIAAVGGGVIAQSMDWRMAFFILGVPGVFAAVVLKLTVKEPPRGGNHAEPPSFKNTLKFLLAKPSFVHQLIGAALAAVFCFSFLQFLVSFFIRAYGLDVASASAIFGVIAGFGVATGIFLGGFLADKLSARYPRAIAWLPGVALLSAAPLSLLGFLVDSPAVASVFLFLSAVMGFSNVAPGTTIGQTVADPRMRATASAILLTASALIGYGFGPPIVGFIADYATAQNLSSFGLDAASCFGEVALPECAQAGAEGLRIGMLCTVVFPLWAGIHYLLICKSYLKDKVA